MLEQPITGEEKQYTGHQREVLAVVLDLMVEAGDGFSLAKVCRRASRRQSDVSRARPR